VVDGGGGRSSDQNGRVEELQASNDAVSARIGIPPRSLDQVNSSRRGSYRDYYDQQLIDAVAQRYRRDLDLFGYQY